MFLQSCHCKNTETYGPLENFSILKELQSPFCTILCTFLNSATSKHSKSIRRSKTTQKSFLLYTSVIAEHYDRLKLDGIPTVTLSINAP